MTLEVRAIRENEKEECLSLWKTAFSFEGNDAYFRRYFEGDVDWLPYYTQVAALDGKIVSAVQIVKRTVSMPDFTLTMGGIANVATLPEFRNRGYNAQCLNAAIRIMEADAMDFSLLFTGIHDYYRRFGFASLPLHELTGSLKPALKLPVTPYLVRPATSADLPAIRHLYNLYNLHRPLSVCRSDAYWRDWIGIEKPGALDEILVATETSSGKDAVPVGYVWVADRLRFSETPKSVPDELTLHEFGTAPDADPEIALALFSFASRWAQKYGATRLCLKLPQEPDVREAFTSLTENGKSRSEGGAMARLLNRSALLNSLALIRTDKHCESSTETSASVVVETPYGNTEIVAQPFRLSTHETDAPAQISQSEFFAALFGVSSLQEKTLPPETKSLLTLLFTGGNPHYASKDGF